MTVGAELETSRTRSLAALAVGLGALALDQLGPWFPHGSAQRIAIGLAATIALLAMARWDRESVGLRLTPLQPWRWWAKKTLLLGAIVAAFTALAFGVLALFGRALPQPITDADSLRWVAWHGVFIAPLEEEPLYRLALCIPIAALAGKRVAIIASGVVFGLLHVRYGNPAPDHLAAGFVLAWAFLESRCLLVAMLLHALGNLCVLLFSLAWMGVAS